jgi:hypothetical protein
MESPLRIRLSAPGPRHPVSLTLEVAADRELPFQQVTLRTKLWCGGSTVARDTRTALERRGRVFTADCSLPFPLPTLDGRLRVEHAFYVTDRHGVPLLPGEAVVVPDDAEPPWKAADPYRSSGHVTPVEELRRDWIDLVERAGIAPWVSSGRPAITLLRGERGWFLLSEYEGGAPVDAKLVARRANDGSIAFERPMETRERDGGLVVEIAIARDAPPSIVVMGLGVSWSLVAEYRRGSDLQDHEFEIGVLPVTRPGVAPPIVEPGFPRPRARDRDDIRHALQKLQSVRRGARLRFLPALSRGRARIPYVPGNPAAPLRRRRYDRRLARLVFVGAIAFVVPSARSVAGGTSARRGDLRDDTIVGRMRTGAGMLHAPNHPAARLPRTAVDMRAGRRALRRAARQVRSVVTDIVCHIDCA